ncbi:hypothetical protein PR048_007525 [Dryococelus australis]|uniref:Uncharacterized protein n=1 Tax=Dryococelus australis TaxID=614101 RepID=A0ABQ9HVE6_9NEOP|nr:hypothetical protein PR048_007525 [Dryococelus australis]
MDQRRNERAVEVGDPRENPYEQRYWMGVGIAEEFGKGRFAIAQDLAASAAVVIGRDNNEVSERLWAPRVGPARPFHPWWRVGYQALIGERRVYVCARAPGISGCIASVYRPSVWPHVREETLLLIQLLCGMTCERVSEEIRTALNIDVMRADEGDLGEYGAAPELKGGGKREIPEKTRRPTASSGRIPTCENPGVTRREVGTRIALVRGQQANRSGKWYKRE